MSSQKFYQKISRNNLQFQQCVRIQNQLAKINGFPIQQQKHREASWFQLWLFVFFISSPFLISSSPMQCLAEHVPYSYGFGSWEECKITGYLKISYRSQLNIYYLKLYRSTYNLMHRGCI